MKRFHGVLICLLAALFHSGVGTPNTAKMSLLQKAHAGIVKLQSWYSQSTGLWRTTGWWNAANAVTVLVDYSRMRGSSRYLSAVKNTYILNSGGGFINKYYDDEGWWALAWIAAYHQTGQKKYLKTAEHIFSNMKGGWDRQCGGGIWWSKRRRYKNAIANELFLSVAANLSARTKGRQHESDLNWASREWKWFSHSGMINSNHLINDGLNAACRNNGKTIWSYNQGVILGGLVALEKDTGKHSLLPTAQSIASAAISKLTDANGVLHDACEPHCGADGDQFKGIFTRNLAILYKADPKSQYLKFLRTNAGNIWNKDAGPDDEFGLIWSGPDMPGNAATQTSAIDCLLAAAEVSPR